MVYCPNCGNPNDDASKFCIKCGHSLAARPETMGTAAKPRRGGGGASRMIIVALLALVVVGMIVIGVYLVAQGIGSGEDYIAYQTLESDGTLSLWVVRPNGEAPIEVASEVNGFQYASALQGEQHCEYTPFTPKGQQHYEYTPFTPNGKRMLFTVYDGEEHSLYTYLLGQDGAERIVRSAKDLAYSFSPDGKRIAVVILDEDGERRLLVMGVDGENEVTLLEGVEGYLGVWWLPNGRELTALLYEQGEYSLLLTDDQGEEQLTIGEEQLTLGDEMEDADFVISSDGGRIAYAVDQDGEWDIYAARADGSDPTRLERGLAGVEMVGFSPDGKQLMMRASSNRYSWDLYLMETDGTGQVTLARDVDEADGGFCPDGKRIWFGTEEDDDWSLYLVDADGENEVRVERRIDDWEVEFTPDGRTMIVGLEKGGAWDLYAVEVATGEMVELISSVDDIGSLVVMDNKQVLFSAEDGYDWSLYVARLDGKDTVELAGPVDGFAGYDASPDGRRIVYSEETSGEYRLYLIDVDGENQEMLAEGGFGPVWSD